MQILKFNVIGQRIKKDLNLPFSMMVAGTSGYYTAEFNFNDDWYGYACIACFKHKDQELYIPIKRGKCEIPDKILEYAYFSISVIGKKNESKLLTNEITITQKGGKP